MEQFDGILSEFMKANPATGTANGLGLPALLELTLEGPRVETDDEAVRRKVGFIC